MAKPWPTWTLDELCARTMAGAPTHRAAPLARSMRRPIAMCRAPKRHPLIVYSAGKLGRTMAARLMLVEDPCQRCFGLVVAQRGAFLVPAPNLVGGHAER